MGGSSSTEQWKGYDHQLLNDKKPRAIAVPESKEDGCSAIMRNPNAKEGYLGFIKDEAGNDLDTATKLYYASIKQYGARPFIGFRPYTDSPKSMARGEFKYITYDEFNQYAMAFGNGLRELGLEDRENVGLFAINRPEWYMVHCANITQSFRTVALYDTLGAQAVAYIVRHAEVPVIVCEKNKLPALFAAVEECKKSAAAAAEGPSASAEEGDEEKKTEEEAAAATDDTAELGELKLKYVIQMDVNELYGNNHETVDEESKIIAEGLGLKLMGLSELFESGKDKAAPSVEIDKEDLAYLMYTSGTTGNPKGVMLPHRAFAAMVATAHRIIKPVDDVHMSYLPLAHIFEAMVQQVMASSGARIAYFQGDVRKLLDDWKAVKPTVLVGVPRVFNKTYDKFQVKVKGFNTAKKWLVQSAQTSSSSAIRSGKRSKFYDGMVWGGVAPELGFDRVRIVVSGAAPLPPHIAEFLRIIMPDASVVQGYGMTENCAGCTLTDLDDLNLGHVGVPIDNMELRLVDAPECGYLTSDSPHPRGEIVCRGLCVMKGYFKNQSKTDDTIKDGWLHTGDIGRINPNGTISIIDRRKNMFKTAMGEYIASEKVEAVYAKASSVAQIFIYGNSFKSFVVAVVVPDATVMELLWKNDKVWKKSDLRPGTEEYSAYFMELAEKRLGEIKDIVMAEMKEESGVLKGFEKVKDVFIEHRIDPLMQGFNVENGTLTPTFKMKRPQLFARYKEQIKQMYADNGEPPLETENW